MKRWMATVLISFLLLVVIKWILIVFFWRSFLIQNLNSTHELIFLLWWLECHKVGYTSTRCEFFAYFFTISYSLAVRFELFDPNEIIASVWVNSCETYFLRCLLMEEIYICACVWQLLRGCESFFISYSTLNKEIKEPCIPWLHLEELLL